MLAAVVSKPLWFNAATFSLNVKLIFHKLAIPLRRHLIDKPIGDLRVIVVIVELQAVVFLKGSLSLIDLFFPN